MLKRHPLLRYYLGKIVTYFVTIWGAFTVAFFMFRLMPTNPVTAWISTLQRQYSVTMTNGPQMVEYYKEQFGLNGTIWDQYTHYLYNLIVKQNMGPSFINFPTPVQNLLMQRLPWTLGLLGVSVLTAWILGLLIGTAIAWLRNSRFSGFITNASITISQIPSYLIALILVLVLGYGFKLFPYRGAYDAQYPIGFTWNFIKSVVWHSFLPALSIIIVSLSGWILTTRSLIVSILGEDYLMYAEAKGLRPWDIMTHYALRNALLPQTMGLALTLGFMMSGQLLIEMLFVYPGIGELMMRAIQVFDFNTMMGVIILSIVSVMTCSLIVEMALPIIDPRIRKEIMA
jgi:peptide/nickel transport system permease protein